MDFPFSKKRNAYKPDISSDIEYHKMYDTKMEMGRFPSSKEQNKKNKSRKSIIKFPKSMTEKQTLDSGFSLVDVSVDVNIEKKSFTHLMKLFL